VAQAGVSPTASSRKMATVKSRHIGESLGIA
jgi:hypothetical protein